MFRRICPALLVVLLLSIGATSAPAAGKPNIILITLSSTRADRMGFLGSKARLTPNLDGLARQSMVFEHAYSQAPLTVVSHATILTGTYPQTHRVSEFGARLAAALPFVPDLLRKGGYRTAAFVGSIALDPKKRIGSRL
jgi:arylsulfatase A-like enzyme